MGLLDSITKRLTLTPVEASNESPLFKSPALASDIRRLFKYFTIPLTLTDEYQYDRQLLFQYNVTMPVDFYLLNVQQYRAFTSSLIIGGCLCIKYRIGTEVFRYKLFDHDISIDWNFFTWYSNQIIKKNFCLEFWGHTLLDSEIIYNRGIIQQILLQMSVMYDPTEADEVPDTTDIDGEDVLRLDDLTFGALPISLPFSQSIIVFEDNA